MQEPTENSRHLPTGEKKKNELLAGRVDELSTMVKTLLAAKQLENLTLGSSDDNK